VNNLRSLSFALAFLPLSAAAARPLTVDDLWAMHRVTQATPSPDGRRIAFVVTTFDTERNAGDADLWVADLEGARPPLRLTSGFGSDTAPFWRPDSRAVGFVRSRENEPSQLYAVELAGGEPQPLLDTPISVTRARWAAGGRHVVFEATTWPELGERFTEVKARLDANKEDKTQARISESRLLRYWDHYLTDGRVPHLFELELGSGRVRDLMPGFDGITGFEGFEWDLSADGGEVAFSANSTAAPFREINFDLFAIDRSRGVIRNLTPDRPGHDTRPIYAPRGRDLLFTTTLRPAVGSELDRLARLEREGGRVVEIARTLDATKGAAQWSRDGRDAYFAAERDSRVALYAAAAGGSGSARMLAHGGSIDYVAPGHDAIAYTRQDFDHPAELHRVGLRGDPPRRLTAFNDARLATLALGKVESVRYAGHGGDPVQAWLVYPHDYTPRKRWPVLLLAHGGPFGAWNDSFNYRWNAHVFAARGYLVAMPNFHGSTGFGQAFADSILGNHGEKPAADMLAARDWLAARRDVDPGRIAIAGGSYGGYLAALLPGLTDKFAASIVHAGVFDLTVQFASDSHWDRPSAYGNAPWTDPVELDRWSPSRWSPKFSTPTLILHGEKDYRVPVSQGINLHGVLTGKGVPARIVIFPDENHWILKPQASKLWYDEFGRWLDRWVKPGRAR
jgi:dipeptidyl aminopeptidase/acylaminoacyl peptidase